MSSRAQRGVARLAVYVLSTVTLASAVAPVAFGADPRAVPSAAPARSVDVEVDASGLEVNEASVEAAVARELGSAGADGVPVHVTLRVVGGAELTVTYRADERAGVSRTVAAPARAADVPELTALLVGNLARDEADGLLTELQKSGAAGEPAAAPSVTAAPELEPPALALDRMNLSLIYPVTLLQGTEQRRLAFELGLFYSRVGALSGVALTLGGVARVDGGASGLQLGGIGHWQGASGAGVRIGGVFGVGAGSFAGVSLVGAVDVHQADLDGAQLAGALNIAEGSLTGVQLGGGMNWAGDVSGAQVSGGLNLAAGPVDGAQISAGLNLAERVRGTQLSLVNIGGAVDGLQLGLVNVATDVTGVQLGLVNVARKVDGVSLGIVPYSQQGRTQAVAWYNSNQPLNLGVRFHTGALYVMPTFGYAPQGNTLVLESSEGSYAPGISLGFRIPMQRAFADLDVNCSNRSAGLSYDEHNVDLRYRLLAGWQLAPAFALFAGGGVRHHFRTQGPEEQSVDPELSVGVQLL